MLNGATLADLFISKLESGSEKEKFTITDDSRKFITDLCNSIVQHIQTDAVVNINTVVTVTTPSGPGTGTGTGISQVL